MSQKCSQNFQSFQQVFQNMLCKANVMFTFSQNFFKDKMLTGHADE